MSRFHLFYVGPGARPLEDILLVREMPGVKIVNENLPRSIVLDVSCEVAVERLKQLPQWALRQSHPVRINTRLFESSANREVPALRVLTKE
jgi:hypothetical protein